MLQQLEKKEEKALNLQENYVSLQQEVDIKTKKLKKVTDYVLLEPQSPQYLLHSIYPYLQCALLCAALCRTCAFQPK